MICMPSQQNWLWTSVLGDIRATNQVSALCDTRDSLSRVSQSADTCFLTWLHGYLWDLTSAMSYVSLANIVVSWTRNIFNCLVCMFWCLPSLFSKLQVLSRLPVFIHAGDKEEIPIASVTDMKSGFENIFVQNEVCYITTSSTCTMHTKIGPIFFLKVSYHYIIIGCRAF